MLVSVSASEQVKHCRETISCGANAQARYDAVEIRKEWDGIGNNPCPKHSAGGNDKPLPCFFLASRFDALGTRPDVQGPDPDPSGKMEGMF